MTDNFQSDASVQGRKLENICNEILEEHDFQLRGSKKVEQLGIEVDQVATSRRGITYWFEFKGSWRPPRPGMIRTDTTKKGLCNELLAYVDEITYPKFIIMTSHLPKVGSSGDAMCAVATKSGALQDLICVTDSNDVRRLNHL